MGTKTPISMLQEIMARVGDRPKYDLIYDGSGTSTNATSFTYKVYAGGVSEIGSGKSKKEAKHEAARVALEALQHMEIVPLSVQHEPVEVVTPYEDKLKENAIGALQKLCARHKIFMPDYRLIDEKGAPHEKVFTYRCSVSEQKEIGVGRTKKQAKQLAAYKMTNKLKRLVGDVPLQHNDLSTEQPSNNDHSDARYVAAVASTKEKYGNPSKYLFFEHTSGDRRAAAWEVLSQIDVPKTDEDRTETDTNWLKSLHTFVSVLDVYTSVIVGNESREGKKAVYIQICESSEAMFQGVGVNSESAAQQAALNAIRFFKTQLAYFEEKKS